MSNFTVGEENNSSRICIKNIGKNTTEKQLKDIFSLKGEVTDVKIVVGKPGKTSNGKEKLAHRGIAFVGFRTALQAEEAKKYFHNSFIGLSKISIEIAKKLESVKNDRAKFKNETKHKKIVDNNGIVSPTVPLKMEKKKLEFFEVMKPRHVSNIFNNDSVEAVATENETEPAVTTESKSDNKGTSDKESKEQSQSIMPTMLSDLEYLKSKMKKSSNAITTEINPPTAKGTQQSEYITGQESKETVPQIDFDGDDSEEGRLFIKNLPFTCTEEELHSHFSGFGPLSHVHISLDKEKKTSKGFAFVQFLIPEHAERARTELAGSAFQGRLLQIVPAKRMPASKSDLEVGTDGRRLSSYQEKKEMERRANANKKEGWNSTFVRSDAVVDSLAERYGISRSAILDTNESGGDLAVRLALGESQIIQENRAYFSSHGVSVFALESAHSSERADGRSSTAIIVKNLPHDLIRDELESMFAKFGSLERFLIPPSKSMAVVQFHEPSEARSAYRGLAYRSYKHMPLYLEWAPLGLMSGKVDTSKPKTDEAGTAAATAVPLAVAQSQASNKTDDPNLDPGSSSSDSADFGTLFVKNLNFISTEDNLRDHLSRLGVKPIQNGGSVRAISIVKKLKGGVQLSQGYGFVEFVSGKEAVAAFKIIDGSVLDSHALVVKPSDKRLSPSPKSTSLGRTNGAGDTRSLSCKLIVRNVAFQATKKELANLFSAFGSLKKVRIPRKMGGEHRGFAFVEFSSPKEAEAAREALKDLHLYGRHLVVEWANEEAEVDEGSSGLEGRVGKGSDLSRLRKRVSEDMTAIRAQSARGAKKAKTEDFLDGSVALGLGDVD